MIEVLVNQQLPILPGRFQPSTFGVCELNYRVRHGYGCILTAIATTKVMIPYWVDNSKEIFSKRFTFRVHHSQMIGFENVIGLRFKV